MNVLEVKNLCYAYIKKPLCLKDVSFSLQKNQRVLVLALDDMGKTTLLKSVSGFDDKYFGWVNLNGKDLKTIPDKEKNFSIIFDYPILISGSIDKNLNFLYETLNKQIASEKEKQDLLEKFKLNYKLKDNIKKLTKFEKFKLCFARVYIKKPQILFIDDILKNKFTDDELEELMAIFKLLFQDKMVIFAINENSYKNYYDLIYELNFDKVFYLNNSKLTELESIEVFNNNPIDLNACKFFDGLKTQEGFVAKDKDNYFLSFNEENEIKVDKDFNKAFDKLNLKNNDNEDIVLVYKDDLKIDLTKDNDFNKLLMLKTVMIFSKLDGSRLIWKCC